MASDQPTATARWLLFELPSQTGHSLRQPIVRYVGKNPRTRCNGTLKTTELRLTLTRSVEAVTCGSTRASDIRNVGAPTFDVSIQAGGFSGSQSIPLLSYVRSIRLTPEVVQLRPDSCILVPAWANVHRGSTKRRRGDFRAETSGFRRTDLPRLLTMNIRSVA